MRVCATCHSLVSGGSDELMIEKSSGSDEKLALEKSSADDEKLALEQKEKATAKKAVASVAEGEAAKDLSQREDSGCAAVPPCTRLSFA